GPPPRIITSYRTCCSCLINGPILPGAGFSHKELLGCGMQSDRTINPGTNDSRGSSAPAAARMRDGSNDGANHSHALIYSIGLGTYDTGIKHKEHKGVRALY